MGSWIRSVGIVAASAGLAAVPATAGAARPECTVERLAPKKATYSSNTQADPLGTAIAAAPAGATLQLIGTCRGSFVVDKSLTLRGRAAETQVDTLDGNGSGAVLTVLGGAGEADPVRVQITNLAIVGGDAGIVRHSPTEVTLDGSAITGHTGPGITTNCAGCAAGPLTLNDSSVTGNGDGIAATARGVVTLNSSTVSHNAGSGIVTTGSSMVNGAVMVLNDSSVASNGGSGITFGRIGSLTLTRSVVRDNGSTGVFTTGSPITGEHATISGNRGGGIRVSFGRLTLTDSIVSDNSTPGNGGGIAGPSIPNQSGTTLTRTTVRGNRAAGDGGGIYSVQASLVDSVVTGNSAGGSGGGIYTPVTDPGGFGRLALTRSIVTGNTAGAAGGGIFQEPGATLARDGASDVCDNVPDDGPGCLTG